MKHRKLTCSALALLLGLTACTQDEQMTEGVEGTPITFTATGLDFNEAHTRATVDNNWDRVTKVAVQIGDEVKTYTVNATANDNKATATLTSTDPFFWTATAKKTVTAWPTDEATPTDLPPVKVQEDQSDQTKFEQSDFIAVEAQEIPFMESKPVLLFKHRTARIKVTLTGNTTGAKVTLENLDPAGIVQPVPNEGRDLKTATTITPYKSGNLVYEALIAPPTDETDTPTDPLIRVTSGDKSFYYPLPMNIEGGKKYSYTFVVDETSLGLRAISRGEWTDR